MCSRLATMRKVLICSIVKVGRTKESLTRGVCGYSGPDSTASACREPDSRPEPAEALPRESPAAAAGILTAPILAEDESACKPSRPRSREFLTIEYQAPRRRPVRHRLHRIKSTLTYA